MIVAEKVIMPKQGLQMTEGTITRWLKKEGEKVETQQPLFEMETDKLNIEMDSPVSGTLLKILRNVGDVVPITETIAIIGKSGEDISEFLKERIFSTPRARMTAQEEGVDIERIDSTGPEGLVIERDVKTYIANRSSEPKATPIAKKIAQKNDVDITGIEGTGARGKITKADVENTVLARTKKVEKTRGERIIPFAGMRKTISDNMMKSLHGMAQANHRMKVNMTEVIRMREKLKDNGIKVSFTDIIIKIVSRALTDFPIMNSSLTDKGIVFKNYVNMGIAVALDNGLIVPVIRDADLMTIQEISTAVSELVEKAKSGCLKSDEYRGGTFTITNLGMFDVDEFTAIINPPESAILAVGKINRIPVAENDNIVIKPIMVLSLTYDHRIIDGAPAAQFLQRVKQIMQNPYQLI